MATEEYGPKRRGADASGDDKPLTIAERKAMAARKEADGESKIPSWLPDPVAEPDLEHEPTPKPTPKPTPRPKPAPEPEVEAEAERAPDPSEADEPAGEAGDVEPDEKKRGKKTAFIIIGGVLAALIVGGAIVIPKVAHDTTVDEYRQATAELQTLIDQQTQHEINAESISVLAALQAPEASALQKQLLTIAGNGKLVTADQAKSLREAAAKIGEAVQQQEATEIPEAVDRKTPQGGWLSVTDPDFGDEVQSGKPKAVSTKDEAKITSADVEQAEAEVKKLQAASTGDSTASPFAQPLNSALATLEDAASRAGSPGVTAALATKGSVAQRVTALSTALSDHGSALAKKERDEKERAAEDTGSTVPRDGSYVAPQPEQPRTPEYVQHEVVVPPEDVPGDYKQWDGDGKWNTEYHPPTPETTPPDTEQG